MPGVADYLVGRMRAAGVRALFGLPGGGGNLDLIEAAGRAGLPFVLTATETGSAIAALAQAEITGAPGACITTLGPGAASVVNGIACAKLDRARVMVVTDSYAASGASFAHQRLDHQALLAPVTKWSGTLAPLRGSQHIDHAFARLAELPPGPVHLDCPADFEEGFETGSIGAMRWEYNEELTSPEFKELISSARRPLMIVGLTARRAEYVADIRAFSEQCGVPALVTYKGKGVVPDSHPWFGGVFTHGAIERGLIDQSDLLIGVGFDPVEILPRPWTYLQPIVSIASWEMPADHVPFRLQHFGDIGLALTALTRLIARTDWDAEQVRSNVAAARSAVRIAGSSDPATLTPQVVVEVAARRLAGRSRVTVDAGAHMFPATMLWPASEPNELLISNGLSTMGFALPAAIGAALLERGDFVPAAPPLRAHSRGPRSPAPFARARDASLAGAPVKPVVALTGDGGLLICMGELATVVRERLKIIVIVFNDSSLSLIEIKQQARELPPAGVALGAIDWAKVGEGFGMASWIVRTAEELDAALEAASSLDGPGLLDVRIDPSGYADTLKLIRG